MHRKEWMFSKWNYLNAILFLACSTFYESYRFVSNHWDADYLHGSSFIGNFQYLVAQNVSKKYCCNLHDIEHGKWPLLSLPFSSSLILNLSPKLIFKALLLCESSANTKIGFRSSGITSAFKQTPRFNAVTWSFRGAPEQRASDRR